MSGVDGQSENLLRIRADCNQRNQDGGRHGERPRVTHAGSGRNTLRRVLPSVWPVPITRALMSANPTKMAVLETADRDRLLRRLVGCFAAAAFVAFGLAITTSVWQRTLGHFDPVTLAQDAPR